MKGTFLQRAARLAAHVVVQPEFLPSYLMHLPAWGRTPLDLALPWFSYGSIRYLERALRPEHCVFEYGTGGSTIFFARRTRQVLSVENDAEWYRRISRRIEELKLENVKCELHEYGDEEALRYPQLPYFKVLRQGQFDVIAVDGFCGFSAGRYGALRLHAFSQACAAVRRPGGMVILDDYWMFPEAIDLAGGIKPLVFQSVGPCRYGVTSTAIFCFDK